MSFLKNNIKDKLILCFDCETEGLNYYQSRPWELSWSIFKNGIEISKYQHFLKWDQLNVSAGAAKATKFNPKVIEEKGEDPKKIIDLFSNYLFKEDYIIVGQNILGYDSMIIDNSRKKFGYKSDFSYLSRCYDTHAISKIMKLDWKPKEDKEEFLAQQFSAIDWKQRGIKTNILTMAQEFKLNFDENKFHEASYDIFLTYQIFMNLVDRLDIPV